MQELRICTDSDRRRGILIYRRFGTARAAPSAIFVCGTRNLVHGLRLGETQSVQKSLCSRICLVSDSSFLLLEGNRKSIASAHTTRTHESCGELVLPRHVWTWRIAYVSQWPEASYCRRHLIHWRLVQRHSMAVRSSHELARHEINCDSGLAQGVE